MDLSVVGENLSQVISWIGTVINSMVGENGELAKLLPLLMVSVSISALLLAVKVIRSFIWGA